MPKMRKKEQREQNNLCIEMMLLGKFYEFWMQIKVQISSLLLSGTQHHILFNNNSLIPHGDNN